MRLALARNLLREMPADRVNIVARGFLIAPLVLFVVWALSGLPGWVFYAAVIVPWCATLYFGLLSCYLRTWRGWIAAIGILVALFWYGTFGSANYWIYSECMEVPDHHHCWESFCDNSDCSDFDSDNPPPSPKWIP